MILNPVVMLNIYIYIIICVYIYVFMILSHILHSKGISYLFCHKSILRYYIYIYIYLHTVHHINHMMWTFRVPHLDMQNVTVRICFCHCMMV